MPKNKSQESAIVKFKKLITEAEKIDYSNTEALCDDIWLFLTDDKMPKKATINREAFNHEVGVMIDIVRQFERSKAAKTNCP